MNTILKGSTAGPIEIRLDTGFDYAGKTVHVSYQGVTRDFPDCVAGGKLELSYGAKETAPMALGVWPIAVWITDEDGTVIRVASTESRIRVTDEPSEVHTSGVIGIAAKGVLAGIEDLPERYTDADVVAKLREILRAGGAAVRTLLVCAALLGASLLNAATVQTAPKQAIYNDQQIVTNVTFEGLARLADLPPLTNGLARTSDIPSTAADVGALPADGTAKEAFFALEASSAKEADFAYKARDAEIANYALMAGGVSWYDIGNRPTWIGTEKPSYTAIEVGATTPEDVTAAIREQSLGGIWDAELQVWWTPRMRNGSLTYEATTNVNLNAEN